MLPPGHVLLPDPPVPGAPADRWWPPQVLTPAWLRGAAGTFDLVHVHFGTESLPPGALEAALAALRELGTPLVHTVHDLEHPQLQDQAHHRRQLDALLGAADELLTLTDRAAATVLERCGRTATVVPHPQLAPDAWFARADELRRTAGTGADELRPAAGTGADGPARGGRPRAAGPVVGVHLRGLRANVRPGAWIAELAEAVAARGGRLRLVVNDEVAPGTAAHPVLLDLHERLRGLPVDHVRRPRPDDDGLAAELAGLDVSVLPYAHGTHSGWLELCWDLGTPVLAPDVGAIADQHREPWALRTFDPGRPGTVAAALDRVLDAPPAPPAAERLAERRRVAGRNHEAHAAAYGRALGRR
ncbi:glycosyltransferase [Patulibacter sp.]|uniref:glycosyltransferase n=1 Tax=Patulibacter sp. TaxID=1912859 RepID=UPI00271A8701|nr:glycosyltransferase [Patulibacter sp.]MDO9409550.1 glycosyltransferase [Patulibacter sp.]